MPRDYAAVTTLIVTKLQSAGTVDYSVAEVDYQIKESLKDVASLSPHLVPVTFSLESRTGNDITGTASKLTDAVKSQFLTTDPANEKVVHNTTDDSWSVVSASTAGISTSILNLINDIMDENEAYEIFNKRCFNKRQIWIGDILPQILDIDSVEYPLGTRRNWKIVSEGILEIDCDFIPDSNTNVDNLPNVTVLVRFVRPHILAQMTDWVGTVAGTAGAAAATTMSIDGIAASATVYEGDEFSIGNFRRSYIITANTAASSAGVATVSFYPGLEGVAAISTTVTFTKSTLKPSEEVAFASLVAGRILQNKSPKFINNVAKGGPNAWSNFYTLGSRWVEEAEKKLRTNAPPKTKKRYPTDL